MQVWALDQEKDHNAKLLKNRMASGQVMLFLLFNKIGAKCFIGNPQKCSKEKKNQFICLGKYLRKRNQLQVCHNGIKPINFLMF